MSSPLTGAHPYLSLTDDQLIAQCEVDTYRASGPGGQKRNKTSSAVRLRHAPTGLSVTASEERSQHVNRARALRRLREAIALHIRAPLAIEAYRPGGVLTGYITPDGQLRINKRNEQYAPVVAEVLDVLAACATRISDAAERLGLSTAHLVKFIETDGKLWDRVNQLRAAAGQKPLR